MKPVKKIIDSIRSRLFLKISIVFIGSTVIVLISSILVHKFFFLPKKFPGLIRNVVYHAKYMIEEIGMPPDIRTAEDIAGKMKIGIRIETEDISWTSDSDIPEFRDTELSEYIDLKGFHAGFNDDGLCVIYENDGYRILLAMHRKREGFRKAVNSIIMLILFFAVIVISILYFIIRWLLRPIRTLKEGVDRVSKGDLDIKMPPGSNDELGILIDSFNSMTRHIGDMIRSRDQLLRDVSHELRSPLTRLRVAVELLDDNELKQGMLDDVNEVDVMISELLETDRLNSRFGKLKPERLDVHDLVCDVVREFEGRQPGIVIKDHSERIGLPADRERVMILLRNVIGNALRFSGENAEPVRIDFGRTNEKIFIRICDSGIGIPEEEIPYIFEPFYRIDKSRSRDTGGYGLGMSLSRKIMDAHKGEIEVQSSPGKGTCFRLIFPEGKK